MDVDDDNLPAPENIPEQAPTTGARNDPDNVEEGWGWNGIKHQKQINVTNVRTSIAGVSSDVVENLSFVGMFFILFLKSMVQIIIEETNKKLDEPIWGSFSGGLVCVCYCQHCWDTRGRIFGQ